MVKVTMYSTPWCGFCQSAERLLQRKGVTDLEKINVDDDPELSQTMMQRSGRRTVPQIFIGERHLGGFDDIAVLDRAGKLDALLQG